MPNPAFPSPSGLIRAIDYSLAFAGRLCGDALAMGDTLTVELTDAGRAEQLVRYLDDRDLDSANRVESDEVIVRLDDGPRKSRIAVLVAIEGWLTRRRDALVVVRVDRRRHRLRPHPEASTS